MPEKSRPQLTEKMHDKYWKKIMVAMMQLSQSVFCSSTKQQCVTGVLVAADCASGIELASADSNPPCASSHAVMGRLSGSRAGKPSPNPAPSGLP